ncbi:MAG: transglycosylase domain-containing protein [Candidatus Dormibacter sp.]|uniref:transglycosylase domain-containing protein n=1 Tax=Candidatus Dormibacter sp. TaxID=2973982 RepID=UPI003D9B9527
MKDPSHYVTDSGRRPRARLHAPWSPLGRRRSRRAALRTLLILVCGLIVLAGVGDVYATSFFDSLPSVQGLDSSAFRGDTLIYDRNGVQLADIGHHGDHHQDVTLDKISPKLIQATVDTEDRTFWTNEGYDAQGIVRAALADLRHGTVVGGGSTITQQLVKQRFLNSDQTYQRKLKELALAYQLNQSYSKQQILQMYLNQNNYSEQQYGVESAALTYFHKHAKDLDLAESALLAGVPQSPSAYDPVLRLPAAKLRQAEVLDAMLRAGDISVDQRDKAAAEPLNINAPTNGALATQFVNYVQAELERLGLANSDQQLIVRTTLDWKQQQLGEQVVRDNLNANKYRDKDGLLTSAMVAMDPRNGELIAYVGSPDFNGPAGNFDFVGDVPVNPGSSVKPYTYAALINSRKATMDTLILDGPKDYSVPIPGGGKFTPHNYNVNTYYGPQPLRVALANSLNVSAVKAEEAVGIPQLVDFYRNLGLRPLAGGQPDAATSQYGPTLTLGGHAITLLQHVTALSVLADLGYYHQPEAILQVTTNRGQTLYQADPERGKRLALDPGVAFMISSILDDDQNRSLVFGRGTPLHLPDRHAAAKTGTTENFHDALTVGWTPQLASVFWVGDQSPDPNKQHFMSGNSDGVYVAAPAWHRFMEGALKGQPNDWYQPPSDVMKVAGNSWALKDAPQVESLNGEVKAAPAASPSPGAPGAPMPSPAPAPGVPPDPGGPVAGHCPPQCSPPRPSPPGR